MTMVTEKVRDILRQYGCCFLRIQKHCWHDKVGIVLCTDSCYVKLILYLSLEKIRYPDCRLVSYEILKDTYHIA